MMSKSYRWLRLVVVVLSFCRSNIFTLASSSLLEGGGDDINDSNQQIEADDKLHSITNADDTNVNGGTQTTTTDTSIAGTDLNSFESELTIENRDNNYYQENSDPDTDIGELRYDDDENDDGDGLSHEKEEKFISPLRQMKFRTITEVSSSNNKYGTEVSWPMQRYILHKDQRPSTTSASKDEIATKMSATQLERYIQYMEGCYSYFWLNSNKCDELEIERIHRNSIQPQYQLNYTKEGFVKMKLPQNLYQQILNVWVNEYHSDDIRLENTEEIFWHSEYDEPISILSNRWVSPTHYLPLTTRVKSSNDEEENQLQQSPSVHQQQLSMKLPGIVQYIQSTMEEWMTNESQGGMSSSSSLLSQPVLQMVSSSSVPTSTLGLRMYSKRSIVAPHVNRLPFVCTAIVNIAQDVNCQSWIYELINHDGIAVNVTLEPGEMLLIESQSIIQGRPYPYQGEYYTNLYVHFEPVDYSFKQEYHLMTIKQQQRNEGISTEDITMVTADIDDVRRSNRRLFQEAFEKHATDSKPLSSSTRRATATATLPTTHSDSTTSTQSTTNKRWKKVPSYIETLIEQERWNQQYVFYREEMNGFDAAFAEKPKVKKYVLPKLSPDDDTDGTVSSNTPGMTKAQVAAANGELTKLKEIAKKHPKLLNAADSNGWKPIHEGARGGHVDIVKFLLKTIPECDINERTNNGSGGSPLWLAENALPTNPPMIQFLRKNGAVAIAPDKSNDDDDEDVKNDDISKNLNEER